MAVIHFTVADRMQTKVVEAGYYPTEITNIEGPKKSASGKSSNYIVDFQITDGQYKGKSRTVMFSSGVANQTVLGEMQMFPTTVFVKLAEILLGISDKPEAVAVDLDELKNKPFDANWDIHTNDGNVTNIIKSFHPRGYAAGAPAF